MAGMSTTVTAVALGDDGCVVANVGDSRTYLLRDGALTQLTHDDSWVQLMIDSGELTPEAARGHPQRSLVLSALDGEPDRGPTLTTFEARPGDRLLLCSDGLSDVVDDDAIAATLRDTTRAHCVQRLIDLALVGVTWSKRWSPPAPARVRFEAGGDHLFDHVAPTSATLHRDQRWTAELGVCLRLRSQRRRRSLSGCHTRPDHTAAGLHLQRHRNVI